MVTVSHALAKDPRAGKRMAIVTAERIMTINGSGRQEAILRIFTSLF
ncbi:MAG: hypothetical protein E7L40_05295 [Corynebacterium kroppenstedtii]|nr:hypothetical protein [Corynebacterium kroppenstedtii]